MDFHLNTPNQLLAKISAALNNLPEEVHLSSASEILVAFSGGPDSTALLLALRLLSKQVGFKLRACHVNHKLRGLDSEADEQFCRQLCTNLSVALDVCEVSEVDLGASESDLRATRYDFLSRCAQRANIPYVFLAHNSSDQVETLLFRIFRGTSPTGLIGMRSAHQMDNGIWLVRPLLSCARCEIDEFLKLNNVTARIDSSNLSDKYTRNFLRNQVIPLCLSRFPSIERQVERLRELISADESYLNEVASNLIGQLNGNECNTWLTNEFRSAHLAIQRRAVAKALQSRNIEVSFERVQAILNMMANPHDAKRTSLDHNWDIDVSPSEIRWIDKQSSAAVLDFEAVQLAVPGRTMLLSLGHVVVVETWSAQASTRFPDRGDMAALVDLSSISRPVVLRTMAESDYINPLGMSQTVGLRRYLRSNCGPGSSLKCWQGLVVAEQSEVLWVPGVGISDKIKVRTNPTHHLSILAISPDYLLA